MILEEQILRMTNMSEHDIREHLKEGVFVYRTYEEFLESWLGGLNDEDEAPAAWEALPRATVDGIEYRYDLAV